MQTIIKQFELFIKLFSSIAFFAVVIGFFDLLVFYNIFDINIADYITISEILLVSLKQLVLIGLGAFLPIGLWVFYLQKIFPIEKEKSDHLGTYLRNVINKKAVKYPLIASFFLIFIAIALKKLFPSSATFYFYYLTQIYSYASFSIFIGFASPALNFWFKLTPAQRINDHRVAITFLIIGISLFFATFVYSTSRANRIRHKENVQLIKLILDNKTIESNNNFRFVSKTSGYYFFWDDSLKQTAIFPSSEIKQIIIQESQ